MSTETKIFAAIVAVTVLLVGGAAMLLGKGGSTAGTSTVDANILVRSNSHAIGPENAKVTIVEFSDFQCPACKVAEPVVKQILGQYGDKIRFIYREFPLPSHEFGFISAQAAEAAALQGKFWEMHEKLFAQSPDLAKDKLIGYAADLGLNTDQFTKDLDSDAVRQRVLDDQSDGNKAGLEATPTFFINGTKFTGGLTLSQFQQEIDSRLR